jgi:hypothetical protein
MMARSLKRLIGLLSRGLLVANWVIVAQLAYLASFFRSFNQAVYHWPEQKSDLDIGVVVFIHFDRSGIVQPYVFQYLDALRETGMSVLFVSNSQSLVPDAIERLKSICDGILIRRNVGYDFSAVREGLEYFGLPRQNTELLLIVNDSVYGPLCSLNDLISRIDLQKAELWGATESWQSRYHLQSYFLAAGRAALHHPAWTAFWRKVRPVGSKAWVIRHYEIGLTQKMLQAGLRCAAIWPYTPLVSAVDQGLLVQADDKGLVSPDPLQQMRHDQATRIRSAHVLRRPLNPTSDLWRQLLQAGFPFIKRELLRSNPTEVADVSDWRIEATKIADSGLSAIEQDLQRALRNRAP